MRKALFYTAVFILLLGPALPAVLSAGNSEGNTVTFNNNSGEDALVKLVGPNGNTRSVEVSNGSMSVLTQVNSGEHYIRVRYGRNGRYHYSRGDRFTVRGDGYYMRSRISITLHKVINGNYGSRPIGASEF